MNQSLEFGVFRNWIFQFANGFKIALIFYEADLSEKCLMLWSSTWMFTWRHCKKALKGAKKSQTEPKSTKDLSKTNLKNVQVKTRFLAGKNVSAWSQIFFWFILIFLIFFHTTWSLIGPVQKVYQMSNWISKCAFEHRMSLDVGWIKRCQIRVLLWHG